MKVQSCRFVSATDLVPKSWRHWFWEAISSDDAPFSWGNNRSMVTASFFADTCQDLLDDSLSAKRFLKKVRNLGEIYIDIES